MTSKQNKPASKNIGKVGSDAKATHDFGGKGDFGIPARTDVLKDHEDAIESRPAGSAPGYSGTKGVRTTGVGSAGGETGHDSGGDLDPDFIGLDGEGGLSAKPVLGHVDGPDDSQQFPAINKQGTGKNRIKPGTHGAAPSAVGDYVDHSGTDSSTINTNAAGSVSPIVGVEPGAEGEISHDEAIGNMNQGG